MPCCPRAFLILALAAVPSAASAAYPDASLYLGLHAGGDIVLAPWDFGENAREDGLLPASGFHGMGGLRLGYDIQSRLAAEVGVSFLSMKSNEDGANTALKYDITGLYHLTDGDWAPIVLGGVGGYHMVSDELGGDFDPQLHLGVGLRGLILPWLALRVEARDVFSDGYSKLGSNNLDLRLGLDVFFKSPDADGDGITDSKDACPMVAGVSSAAGCPDADGDSIKDGDDACPADAGVAEFKGCADTDGDGIADPDDRCPAEAGLAALQGCPDTDGDGIADPDDKCPKVPGKAATKGCPDRDDDGVADGRDECPDDPGAKSAKGCPDRDGDGVIDKDDKCPDVRGLPSYKGCIPSAVAKFTGAIKGITFATNSAEIAPASFGTIDKAVAVLVKYTDLRLDIEGHTDDVGEDAANQTLSEARAASVKAYMVSKGIEEGRLETHGYGEAQPVAPNTSDWGRSKNRRIEFKILGPALEEE